MKASDINFLLVSAGVSQARANQWDDALVAAFARASITTPLIIGHALSQILHEGALFRYMEEIWGPTPAQRRYEGRRDLGNVVRGDGYKFRGRSPIQLTGRDNYTRFNAWLKVVAPELADVVVNPDLVATQPYAALALVWFWMKGNRTGRNLSLIAAKGDTVAVVREVTVNINGGYNGLDDRLALFIRVMTAVRKLPTFKGLNVPL